MRAEGTCSITWRTTAHDREGGLSHALAAGVSGAVLSPEGHHPQGPEPENILLDAELNAKLADFGLSSEFTGHKLSVFCAATKLSLCQAQDDPGVDT